jgi:PRTRC genetic system protein A
MNISNAILATDLPLPPIAALGYEYVLAGNGLFIRAEDSRLEACIPIADVALHGLVEIKPVARLKVDRVPAAFLHSILASAIRHMPDEALYQLRWSGEQHNAVQRTWSCLMPAQIVSSVSIAFDDYADSVIDLHSHNSMEAFFSDTDDRDEQGLRFYAVIGKLRTSKPEICVRAGVYGHHWEVPVTTIFDGAGPFIDVFDDLEKICRVCGCTDSHGCDNGCSWVEPDLCSNCADTVFA